MHPWLADDSQKLYQSLAVILRHIGLSLLKSGNKMKEVNIKGGEAGGALSSGKLGLYYRFFIPKIATFGSQPSCS
ncbi:hypothetical protein QJS10_CPA05g00891 [Acorus calamus]|uniref:Uncharacterized protein n=1 Tax=Acorus calamus TaxID=4465 RepID=A0AAV9EWE9_ACOCL|nr:hypothetical protein QJS10_CPA05g00891 [Acorus calamus]